MENLHYMLFLPDGGGGGAAPTGGDPASTPNPVAGGKDDPAGTPQGGKGEPDSPIELTKSEYERLLGFEKKYLEMVPKTELDRLRSESDKNLAKMKSKAEADAFKNSGELLNLKTLSQNYELGLKTEDFTSLEAVKTAFIEEAKSKFGVNFELDKTGDLDTQIKNLCLLIQETNIFKQIDGLKSPKEGEVVNNTKARQLEESLKAQGRF